MNLFDIGRKTKDKYSLQRKRQCNLGAHNAWVYTALSETDWDADNFNKLLYHLLIILSYHLRKNNFKEARYWLKSTNFGWSQLSENTQFCHLSPEPLKTSKMRLSGLAIFLIFYILKCSEYASGCSSYSNSWNT